MRLENLQKLTFFIVAIWFVNMGISTSHNNEVFAQEIEKYGLKYGHWLQKSLPKINLPDINGRRIDVPDYGKNGKITIFKFWSAWSLACQHELESTAALKKDWGGKLDVDIEIVSVSLYDPRNAEKIKEYMDKNNMEFDVLLDRDDLFLKVFKAKGDVLPYTIVVDHKGNVIFEGKSEGNFFDDKSIKNIIADARSRLPKVTPAEQRMNEKMRQQHRSLKVVSNNSPSSTGYQTPPVQVTGYQPIINNISTKTTPVVPTVKDIPIVTLEEQRGNIKTLKPAPLELVKKPEPKPAPIELVKKPESKPAPIELVKKPEPKPVTTELVSQKKVKPALKFVPTPTKPLPKPEIIISGKSRFANSTPEPKPAIVEKPKTVTKPKPVIVEKPKVVAKPKPAIVEKPKVVAKPKPVIVEKPKVVEKPKPVIVEKPKVVEKPKPVIVEKPKVVEKPKPIIAENPAPKKKTPPLTARTNPVMKKTTTAIKTTKTTPSKTAKSKELAVLDRPPVLVFGEDKKPKKVADRGIKPAKKMQIKTLTPVLKIWDTQYVDGDTLSLILNGEWILKNHLLTDKEIKINITLSPKGDNYLILYAHNEGERPPNTAAVAIFDGKKERTFHLSSNMKNCDAVNLKFTSE